MLTALEGSVGYSLGGARVEVEVGYERFVIKGAKKSGKKHEDADSVFLLGKELAHDTARGQVDRLANALGKMTKADAKKWGNSIENATGSGGTTASTSISSKVCGPNGTSSKNKCGQSSDNGTISAVFSTENATLLSTDTTNINTQGMATNINTLTKEEKAIVAGCIHSHILRCRQAHV